MKWTLTLSLLYLSPSHRWSAPHRIITYPLPPIQGIHTPRTASCFSLDGRGSEWSTGVDSRLFLESQQGSRSFPHHASGVCRPRHRDYEFQVSLIQRIRTTHSFFGYTNSPILPLACLLLATFQISLHCNTERIPLKFVPAAFKSTLAGDSVFILFNKSTAVVYVQPTRAP